MVTAVIDSFSVPARLMCVEISGILVLISLNLVNSNLFFHLLVSPTTLLFLIVSIKVYWALFDQSVEIFLDEIMAIVHLCCLLMFFFLNVTIIGKYVL